jgi:hypothetical protein
MVVNTSITTVKPGDSKPWIYEIMALSKSNNFSALIKNARYPNAIKEKRLRMKATPSCFFKFIKKNLVSMILETC